MTRQGNYIPRKPGTAADFKRHTREGFLRYMLSNPEYFQSVYKKTATKENINQEFDNVLKGCLDGN